MITRMKIKAKKSVLFFLSLFLALNLTGCGPSETSTLKGTSDNAANIDILKRSIGSAYDSARNLKYQACIEPSQFVYAGENSSELSYLRDYSYDQLVDELGMGVFAKLNLFGLVKAKVSGDITSTLSTSDDSSAFLYKFDVVGKSAVLKKAVLSAAGLSAYQRNDPLYFRDTCGDQFVEQVQLGAQLFIGVKYTFTNKVDKEKLQIQLKGSALWGLIKFSKTWSKDEIELLKNVRVSVEAYQVGGNPKKLEILQKSILQDSCAGDDMARCAEGLDKLLAYAKYEFSTQLNGMDVSTEADAGPAIIGVTTVPYRDYAIYDEPNGKLIRINVDADTSVKSSFGDALTRLTLLRWNLRIELSRRIALLEFKLSEIEKASIVVSRHELEGLLDGIDVLLEKTCVAAKQDDRLMETCVQKLGAIELKGQKALLPFALPSRS